MSKRRSAIEIASHRVIEQACEDVAGGAGGASDELRVAVLQYYRACGDDELAADLAAEIGGEG